MKVQYLEESYKNQYLEEMNKIKNNIIAVEVKDQRAHTYVYVESRAQSEEELLLGLSRPRIEGIVCH